MMQGVSVWVPLVDESPELALLTAVVQRATFDAMQPNDPRLRSEALDFLQRFSPRAHSLLLEWNEVRGGTQRKIH